MKLRIAKIVEKKRGKFADINDEKQKLRINTYDLTSSNDLKA